MRQTKRLGFVFAIVLLSTTLAGSSPGPIWNIRTKGTSPPFGKAASGISANFLLGASAAFRMFGEVEKGNLNPAVKAGADSIGFMSKAKAGFLSALKLPSDLSVADSALKKADFAAVELSLRVPKEGAARDDWSELVNIVKDSRTSGVLKYGQTSTEMLATQMGQLIDLVRQKNRAPEPIQLTNAILAWNREIQKGAYVSAIYSER